MAIGAFIAAIFGIVAALSSFAAGRRLKESLLLKIPVMGGLYHSSILSKLAEAMSLMVAAGCSMPECIRLSADAAGSEKLILETNALAEQIEHGSNILEAGQFCRLIPRLILYSVQLGSQRNELQDNLYSLGQMYASQVRCSQARLQALLLPVMIIAVGTFIGMCITAIFLPIIQMVSSLGG
jgi:type IV pilus assembly protein PilC